MKNEIRLEGAGFLFAVTGLLKLVWNNVCPDIFGLKKITYKQSLLIYILFKALFGASNVIKDSFKVDQSYNNSAPKKASDKANEESTAKEDVKIDNECDKVEQDNTDENEVKIEETE